MFIEIVFVILTFSLLGFIKIPKKRNGVLEYEFLFKSHLLPQLMFYSVFIMVLNNIFFFKEVFNYIGLLITFIVLLILTKVITWIVQKMLVKPTQNFR